jgi:preprotein translocase subunit SecY
MSAGWRKALAFVSAIASIELGARIGLPGVDAIALLQYFDQAGRPFLVSAFAVIAGGGLFRAGVLALGIMPYLSARIYMRLWRVVRPTQPSAREERVRTRLLTGALAVIQSIGFATFLQRVPGAVANPGVGFMTTTVLTLTAGSLLAMWFGEKLTQDEDSDEFDPPHAIGDDSTLRQHIASGSIAHAKEASAVPPSPERVPR